MIRDRRREAGECPDCGEKFEAGNKGALKAKMAAHVCPELAPPINLTTLRFEDPVPDDPRLYLVRTRYKCWTCRGLAFEGDPALHLDQHLASVAPTREAVLAFR